ncbi:hypothetical protein TeGR_g7950 [Tetraparma gracilis]|uniref:Pseudouridine synthase n=1 Tax=Tetraparma gracilis TaxID=2962635 RepID=A0ABQ6MXQ9_9STRA|nr:hypothetical protein TeGR_g7950 [Tetraparma gracilis]
MLPLRLPAYLHAREPSLFPSEAAAAKAVSAGLVALQGSPAELAPASLVFPGDVLSYSPASEPASPVSIEGPPPPPPPPSVHYIDKPTNSVSDMSIPNEITLACRALGPGFGPVGQLDLHTTGVLLLTDSARLQRLVNLPGALSKTYRVSFDAPDASPGLAGEQRAALLAPTDLSRGKEASKTLACFTSLSAVTKRYTIRNPKLPPGCAERARFSVDAGISSGQNHVVKRMMASVGVAVKELRRVKVGPVEILEDPADATAPEPKKKKRKGGGAQEAPAAKVAAKATKIEGELLDQLLAAVKYESVGDALRRCDLICQYRGGGEKDERLGEWLDMTEEEKGRRRCFAQYKIPCRFTHN